MASGGGSVPKAGQSTVKEDEKKEDPMVAFAGRMRALLHAHQVKKEDQKKEEEEVTLPPPPPEVPKRVPPPVKAPPKQMEMWEEERTGLVAMPLHYMGDYVAFASLYKVVAADVMHPGFFHVHSLDIKHKFEKLVKTLQ